MCRARLGVPLAVKTYIATGVKKSGEPSLYLALGSSSGHKARVISDMYGRLNVTLGQAITRSILARNMVSTAFIARILVCSTVIVVFAFIE